MDSTSRNSERHGRSPVGTAPGTPTHQGKNAASEFTATLRKRTEKLLVRTAHEISLTPAELIDVEHLDDEHDSALTSPGRQLQQHEQCRSQSPRRSTKVAPGGPRDRQHRPGYAG